MGKALLLASDPGYLLPLLGKAVQEPVPGHFFAADGFIADNLGLFDVSFGEFFTFLTFFIHNQVLPRLPCSFFAGMHLLIFNNLRR